jgi:hypothetical protein
MSQAKMIAARELIQEKNYALARALLSTIKNNPKAQEWLAKLDQIAPEQPAAQVLIERSPIETRKPRWEMGEIVWDKRDAPSLYFIIPRVVHIFWLRAIGEHGVYNAAEVSFFGFTGWPPEPTWREAVAQHNELIASLVAAGWEPTGRGASWWSERFRREVS